MAERIAIMGAGALGSYVGAFLTQAGEDITFIDMWPEHVETMRKDGLRASGSQGDFTVPVKAMHLTEAQWAIVESLIPKPRRRRDGRGRPWREAREVLDGILWVLRTGAPWKIFRSGIRRTRRATAASSTGVGMGR